MWVICWYSCGWSGLAGLRWLYSYVSLWAGIVGRLWKVLEGQALLRSLTSYLVAQRSQNKGPKRQEVEAAYLLWPGNWPSISPAIFYWSRKSRSRDRLKKFSWIQMGREVRQWEERQRTCGPPSFVPAWNALLPDVHLPRFLMLRPQLACCPWPLYGILGPYCPYHPLMLSHGLPFILFDCLHSCHHHLKLMCLPVFPF